MDGLVIDGSDSDCADVESGEARHRDQEVFRGLTKLQLMYWGSHDTRCSSTC